MASPNVQEKPTTLHLNGHSADPEQGHVHSVQSTEGSPEPQQKHHYGREYYDVAMKRQTVFWNRLRGKGKRKVGWVESMKNALFCSWLNVFLVFIPIAWVAHWEQIKDHNPWPPRLVFSLCFIAIIPLEGLFDWGGEQMSIYLGPSLGDLLVITLNNAVEAALAIILLTKCELRLLQSTIVGVVILHLLLVPGTAFLTGGARVWEQTLHPHNTQLNHSLLMIGILSLLLPTAFFAALDRGSQTILNGEPSFAGSTLLTDEVRADILKISRGFAFILGVIYIASRVYLSNPPGDDNALKPLPNMPDEIKEHEKELNEVEPEINPLACILLLCAVIALMAATAEWLVESIEFVREDPRGRIKEEWFGLILLPIVSFSADGVVAIVYFCKRVINHFLGRKVLVPSLLARARAIDLSIQFTLFWMPFVVLLGWIINKPMMLLFDYFELSLLLGSCFLVNYVTADAKTNWVEGLIMVSFYVMIAVSAWFYVGQPELEYFLQCATTVLEAVTNGIAAGHGEGGAAGHGEAVVGGGAHH